MNQLTFDFADVQEVVPMDSLAKAEHIIHALKKFRVDIEAALLYGSNSHSFNDVVATVFSGELELHALPNSVILMEHTKYPNHSVYHAYIAAGDLQEILDALPMLDKRARELGCKYLTLNGRRGWESALKNYGWTYSLSMMEKEVSYG